MDAGRTHVSDMFGVDWGAVVAVDTPLTEIIVRGSLTYLGIFAFLRLFKREAGSVGITDLLVLVLIADAAQNAMAANYTSVTDGAVLVGTLLFWSYALDWLGYHVPQVQRLVRPRPMPLIRDGRPLEDNLRRQLITGEELLSQVRLGGAENLARVKAAYVEVDGRISVILDKDQRPGVRVHPLG
jgi:uncharacterized membrane protein YcaP (DUF421 family)